MNKFQLAVLLIFGFFAAIAVLIFTGAIPMGKGGTQIGGSLSVWGTFPQGDFGKLVTDAVRATNVKVEYKEKDPATFERELVEALAAGTGPDLFFLPHDTLLKQSNKVRSIPYSLVSERTFRESYLEEASIFLGSEGIMALPVLVDPMVLYWNRDTFSQAGIAAPPASWSELFALVPKLTIANNRGVISKSTIALGEFRNITHAKELLTLLILQTGNKIIEPRGGAPTVTLAESPDGKTRPAESALLFFTEFANPSKKSYSWNRSLPASRDMFISEDLAMYVGFGNELAGLKSRNQRLSIGSALIPTIDSDPRSRLTFGRMYAVAIAKNSKNPQAAAYIAFLFASDGFLSALEKITGLPPARRALLTKKPSDPHASILYDAAVMARAWPDPNAEETAAVFRDMIENVTSGRLRIAESIQNAAQDLSRILNEASKK